MRKMSLLSIAFGFAFVAAACGDDGGSSTQQDSGVKQDALEQLDSSQPDTSLPPQQDAGPDGPVTDNNDSFDEAIDIAYTDTAGKSGVIKPAGDVDYFKFDGQEGDWVTIFISANTSADPARLDSVVTLYDSTETQIAQNDDQVLGVYIDSFLVTRLPATGTYYVTVQDWYSAFAPDEVTPDRGGNNFIYKLYVVTLDDSVDGVVIDPENGNDAQSAVSLELPTDAMGTAVGDFADAADVDVFSFTLAQASNASLTFAEGGVDGNGSTTTVGPTYITNTAGDTIFARIDGSAGPVELSPPLAAGDYLLWVAHPGTQLGSNDFYAIADAASTTDNPPEAEAQDATGANDTLDTAETITLDSSGSGFILAYLPDGDVDYFKFAVAANKEIAVACGSARLGSGVQDLTAAVNDASDTEIQSGTEVLTDDLLLGGTDNPITVTTAGTYYLKLTKAGQVSDVTGTYVRCGVHVQTPTTP